MEKKATSDYIYLFRHEGGRWLGIGRFQDGPPQEVSAHVVDEVERLAEKHQADPRLIDYIYVEHTDPRIEKVEKQLRQQGGSPR